jgi:hypothetical protein
VWISTDFAILLFPLHMQFIYYNTHCYNLFPWSSCSFDTRNIYVYVFNYIYRYIIFPVWSLLYLQFCWQPCILQGTQKPCIPLIILAVICLHTNLSYCLLSLLFNTEDGGNMFFRHFGKRLPDYMASHPWSWNSLFYICTPIPNSFYCPGDETWIHENTQPPSCELIVYILSKEKNGKAEISDTFSWDL